MDQIDFYKAKLKFEIDSWDLSVSIKNGEPVTVIDARSSDAFEEQHIPGAISFPHRTMSPDTTAHLDKSVLYVTYCDGIGCNASTKAALNHASLGFRVKELLGGLDWWRRDGYETNGKSGTPGTQVGCEC